MSALRFATLAGMAIALAAPAAAARHAEAKAAPAEAHHNPRKTAKPSAKPQTIAKGDAVKQSRKGKAAAEQTVPTDEETVHVVKPGETLGGIANRAKVPRVLIAEANALPKPWTVRAGQKLRIPRTRHHTVAEGETGFDIAYRYGVPFGAIAVANGMSPKAVLKTGQELLIPTVLPTAAADAPKTDAPKTDPGPPQADRVDRPANPAAKGAAKTADSPARVDFAWPLEGKVRRGFSPRSARNYHDGIDIVAPPDAAVRAAEAGTVIFAGKEPKSFGNLVVVQHAGEWQTAYGFLGRITVAKGDAVRRRERIGLVGHSGKATRDELHFEIRRDNTPVDPADRLPSRD